jgi:hypothetical protein
MLYSLIARSSKLIVTATNYKAMGDEIQAVGYELQAMSYQL